MQYGNPVNIIIKEPTKNKLTINEKIDRLKRVIKATELESFKNNRQWAIKHANLRKMRDELYRLEEILRRYKKLDLLF